MFADAAAELRRLHAENECLAALVEAQQPATHVLNPAEIAHVAGDVSKNGLESNIAPQPAPSAAAAGNALPEGWVPLVITHEGQYPEEVAYGPQILMDRLGKWLRKYFDHVVASKAQPSPTPQADSQPAPVPTSATGGDWTQPTTVALRLGDAMQLLCGGKRPPDDMVQQWLDNTSESLQEFAASNGPAWAQGIGLIDAAMVMVDQPTEITTIDNPDRDHEHRAARAPADSVTAPAGGEVAGPSDYMLGPWFAAQHSGYSTQYWTIKRRNPAWLGGTETGMNGNFNPRRFKTEAAAQQAADDLNAAAPTTPAQAADSVLEDAARWNLLPAFIEKYQIDYVALLRDIEAARKQGAM